MAEIEVIVSSPIQVEVVNPSDAAYEVTEPAVQFEVQISSPTNVDLSQPGPQGPAGLPGSAGIPGEPGADGAPGPAGATDYTALTNKPDLSGYIIGPSLGTATDRSIPYFDTTTGRFLASPTSITINTSGRMMLAGTGSTAGMTISASGNTALTITNGGITFGADTNLYRGAANLLKTDSTLHVVGNIQVIGSSAGFTARGASGATIQTFSTRVVTDTVDRFYILADGKMVWGPGASTAIDTNLYRYAVGVVRTDQSFQAGGTITTAGSGASAINLTNTTIGTGITIGGDTNLYRSAAAMLKTDNSLTVGNIIISGGNIALNGGASYIILGNETAATNTTFAAKTAADTQNRFTLTADGAHAWGPGGTTATDTTLFRSGVATLRTTGGFITDGSFAILGGGGISFGAAYDTNLYRSAADTLKTDDTFVSAATIGAAGNFSLTASTGTFMAREQGATGNAVFQSKLAADSTNRFVIAANGDMFWGPGGATAIDAVKLARNGTNGLQFTGAFSAGTVIATSDLLGAVETYTFTSSGALTVVAGKGRLPIAGGTFTILSVAAMVNTAPTGATVIVDVNKNGTTIYGTQANRPTVAVSAFGATVGAASVTTVTTGDYLSIDIDQIGSTVAGSDLTVVVRLKRTA